jgi:hypothetical protein
MRLSTQAESANQRLVAIVVNGLKIFQKPTTATDELQEASPGVMILFVCLKVFSQVPDPSSQDRNLNFR